MPSFKVRAVAAAIMPTSLIAAAGTAAAEEGAALAASSTPVVTVLATPLERHPGGLFILERAALEPFHAVAATDLLRRIPGVHVDRSGGRGGASGPSPR